VQKIVVYPSEILRSVTPKIGKVDKVLLAQVDKLKKILETSENGAGLAATQIGLNKRFFGLKDVKTKNVYIFINPEINVTFGEKVYPMIKIEGKEEENFLEGCLSFPDYYGTVKRFLNISVCWQEIEEGRLINKTKELSGFEAIVFQHELDHLNGILFVDRVFEEGGKFYKSVGEEMKVWNVKAVVEGKL